MWALRRFLPLLRTIFLLLLTAGAGGVSLPQTLQQEPGSLPGKWNEAVQALTEKIFAELGTSSRVFLEVNNISSLSAADSAALLHEFEKELRERRVRPASAASTDSRIRITLSENLEGYLWVAEVHKGGADQTFLQTVPRQSPGADKTPDGSLTLSKKLIWEQPERFLDFKLFANSGGAFSTLAVLSSEQLTIYRAAEAGWRPLRTIPVPHKSPPPREGQGSFETDGSAADLPEARCVGDFEQPEKIECSPWKQQIIPADLDLKIRGHEGSAGAILWDKCGTYSIALASGTGDWTEPDTLQGFLFAHAQDDAVPSGNPIRFDGPVLSVYREGKESAARAVVRNLRTGNYEGYFVQAACSH